MKTGVFNLIASGCGTGKSYFIANCLLDAFPDVTPGEILFVTSRSITVDQQINYESVERYLPKDLGLVRYWNGETEDFRDIAEKGIHIMTYDKLIHILVERASPLLQTLARIKIVVLDECHTIFSDDFIKNIVAIKMWVSYEVKNKLFLGLTATPGILRYFAPKWGIPIHQINDQVIINYKAKHLICSSFYGLIPLIRDNLRGKTIVMCRSVKDCKTLHAMLSNSAILVSKSNEIFTPEMEQLREYIVKFEQLPNVIKERQTDGFYKEIPLNVLLATSTMREGVSLRKESGVQNIACCYCDELHIAQFMGRARYNIQNLIVVNRSTQRANSETNPYYKKQRKLFNNFLQSGDTKWFDGVEHLVSHGAKDITYFLEERDVASFRKYIDHKWLAVLGEDLEPYKIYRQEDKIEIINMAVKCHMFPENRTTFRKILKATEDEFGLV